MRRWMPGKYQTGWLRMRRSRRPRSLPAASTTSAVGARSGHDAVDRATDGGRAGRGGLSNGTSSWLPRSVGLVLRSLRIESRSDAKLFSILFNQKYPIKLNSFFFSFGTISSATRKAKLFNHYNLHKFTPVERNTLKAFQHLFFN